MVAVQKGYKRAQKWITPILLDKGAKKNLTKDKGKMPMGRNEATALERRKGLALHIP